MTHARQGWRSADGGTPPPVVSGAGTSRQRGILVALVVGDAAFAFQQLAVVPAFPVIQADLGASETWTAWLLSAYLLVASVTAPFLGSLADRRGAKKVLLLSLGVFLVGTVGAALAPDLVTLLLARAVQGVGGAVFPLSFTLVREHLPHDRTGSAIGVLTAGFGLGGAAGLVLGGALTEALSWRWVFGVGSLVVLAAASLTVWLVPRSRRGASRGLDVPGAALLGLGLAAGIAALTEGPNRGAGSPLVLALAAGAVVVLAAFTRRELSTRDPLLDLPVLSRRPVLLTNVASFLAGYALFGIFYLLPFSASSRGGGALTAGLLLLPVTLGQVLAGPLGGWLDARVGGRRALGGSLAVVAAGALALALVPASWQGQTAPLALLGLGFGVAVVASNALLARAVPQDEVGAVTAVNSVMRRIGGSVGGQVGAGLLAVLGDRNGGDAFSIAFAVSAASALVAAGCALAATARDVTPAARQVSPGDRRSAGAPPAAGRRR